MHPDKITFAARVDQAWKERKGVVTAPVETLRAERLDERIFLPFSRMRKARCKFVGELEKFYSVLDTFSLVCNLNLNKMFRKEYPVILTGKNAC